MLKTSPFVPVAHFFNRVSGIMPLDMQCYPQPRPAPVNPLPVYFPHEFIGYAVDHSSQSVFHAFKPELFHCQTFDSPFRFASGSLSVGHIAEYGRDTHCAVSQISDFQTLFLYIPFKPFAVKIVQCIIPPSLSVFHVINSPVPPVGSLFLCNNGAFVKGFYLHAAHNAVAY